MDVINDILQVMHIRGRVCCHAALLPDSGMVLKTENRFVMHAVLEGECWAGDCATGARMKLTGGDVLMLPRGGETWFSDAPECPDRAPCEYIDESYLSLISNGLRRTALIMGSVIEFVTGWRHPLIQGLADAVTVSGEHFLGAGLSEHAAKLIDRTTRCSGEYSNVILDKLFEIFLYQALHAHYFEEDTKELFAHALARPQIRDALMAMHKDPHRNWTVERLAEVCGMSRSAFAHCFTEQVGVPVMRYLTQMRMHRALELIRCGDVNFEDISCRVGYLSHVAFQKAFKRVYGVTPAQARLAAQSSASPGGSFRKRSVQRSRMAVSDWVSIESEIIKTRTR